MTEKVNFNKYTLAGKFSNFTAVHLVKRYFSGYSYAEYLKNTFKFSKFKTIPLSIIIYFSFDLAVTKHSHDYHKLKKFTKNPIFHQKDNFMTIYVFMSKKLSYFKK